LKVSLKQLQSRIQKHAGQLEDLRKSAKATNSQYLIFPLDALMKIEKSFREEDKAFEGIEFDFKKIDREIEECFTVLESFFEESNKESLQSLQHMLGEKRRNFD